MNVVVVALAWLAAAPGLTVSGKVQDADQRAVGQHPIVLKSKTDKTSFYGVTDAKGGYAFYNIPAGTYELESVKEKSAKVDVQVGGGEAGKVAATPTLTLKSTPALRLMAEAQDAGKRYANGKTKYDFALWLDGPPAVIESIARVEYKLVYQKNPLRLAGEARNPKRPFVATYLGWGCYENVTAVIGYKNGTSETKRFDLCTALGWD
jgi:hypothetical protein